MGITSMAVTVYAELQLCNVTSHGHVGRQLGYQLEKMQQWRNAVEKNGGKMDTKINTFVSPAWTKWLQR